MTARPPGSPKRRWTVLERLQISAKLGVLGAFFLFGAVFVGIALFGLTAFLVYFYFFLPGQGVDRGDYVAANEALLAEARVHPQAEEIEITHSPYYSGDISPVNGYTTNVTYKVDELLTIAELQDFYLEELPPRGWTLARRTPEGLSFRQGTAILAVMTSPPGPKGTVPMGTAAPGPPAPTGPPSDSQPTAPPPPQVLEVRYEDRIYGFEIAIDHDSYRYRN